MQDVLCQVSDDVDNKIQFKKKKKRKKKDLDRLGPLKRLRVTDISMPPLPLSQLSSKR